MKDITATLRRIDEELTATRQQIAALQVSIVRLEDTRRVLMGLAEADQAAEAHRGDALLPGSSARPQLIVRPTGTINGKKVRRKRSRSEMRDRILILLKHGKPMTTAEIGDALDLPKGEAYRKPMSNALYNMRITGMVDRLGKGGPGSRDARYTLAVQQ